MTPQKASCPFFGQRFAKRLQANAIWSIKPPLPDAVPKLVQLGVEMSQREWRIKAQGRFLSKVPSGFWALRFNQPSFRELGKPGFDRGFDASISIWLCRFDLALARV